MNFYTIRDLSTMPRTLWDNLSSDGEVITTNKDKPTALLLDIADGDLEEVFKENLEIDNEFVKDIVYGVVTSFDELTDEANKYLKDWTIDRIDATGAAILRMALYEIKYTDTPNVVVINEAVELAKKYSDEEVRKMINAVLDKVISE